MDESTTRLIRLFAIGVVLILMGRTGDVVVTAGLVLLNVITGVWQEGRAKRKLDQIALLTRPTATVIRESVERAVDPAEIVLGDVLVIRPGDQIVVDGKVIGPEGGRMVQIAAVIVALVPQGLFFMTTVTYAMGAVRMAGKGALVQQANAIESVSRVTGWSGISSGKLRVDAPQSVLQVHAIGHTIEILCV